MTDVRDGGCQCGVVRYQVEGEPLAISICHCSECQRQSGSAFGMHMVVRKEAFHLLRGTLNTHARTGHSGCAVVGAFCPECGVRIYNEPQWLDGILTVKPGTLDDASFIRPTVEIWTNRKHKWLELLGSIQSFERNPSQSSVRGESKDASTQSRDAV